MTEAVTGPLPRLEIYDHSSGLALKQLVIADAEVMFSHMDSDEKRQHLSNHGEPTGTKYEDVQAIIDSIEFPENKDRLRFGIWDDETMVGSINLTPITQGPYFNGSWKTAEIGYWIGSEHLGHGYASKATELLAEFAFSAHQYGQLLAMVNPHNIHSINIVEALGFVDIGIEGVGPKTKRVYSLFKPL